MRDREETQRPSRNRHRRYIKNTAPAVGGELVGLFVPGSAVPEPRELLIRIRAQAERPPELSAAKPSRTVLSPVFGKA